MGLFVVGSWASAPRMECKHLLWPLCPGHDGVLLHDRVSIWRRTSWGRGVERRREQEKMALWPVIRPVVHTHSPSLQVCARRQSLQWEAVSQLWPVSKLYVCATQVKLLCKEVQLLYCHSPLTLSFALSGTKEKTFRFLSSEGTDIDPNT